MSIPLIASHDSLLLGYSLHDGSASHELTSIRVFDESICARCLVSAWIVTCSCSLNNPETSTTFSHLSDCCCGRFDSTIWTLWRLLVHSLFLRLSINKRWSTHWKFLVSWWHHDVSLALRSWRVLRRLMKRAWVLNQILQCLYVWLLVVDVTIKVLILTPFNSANKLCRCKLRWVCLWIASWCWTTRLKHRLLDFNTSYPNTDIMPRWWCFLSSLTSKRWALDRTLPVKHIQEVQILVDLAFLNFLRGLFQLFPSPLFHDLSSHPIAYYLILSHLLPLC